jgi:hypothetical protein
VSNAIDLLTPYMKADLAFFGSDVTYTPQGQAPTTLRAYMRGLRADDTFAAAMQQDIVAVVDAARFVAITGLEMPRRFDRIVAGSQSYAVQEWRPSPAMPPFVFFKILVRGSQQ